MVRTILNDVRNLKREVRIQLEQHKSGSPFDNAARELQAIFHELDTIEDQVLNGENPDRQPRYGIFYTLVTDAWGIDSELGDKLLDFANKYQEFI